MNILVIKMAERVKMRDHKKTDETLSLVKEFGSMRHTLMI